MEKYISNYLLGLSIFTQNTNITLLKSDPFIFCSEFDFVQTFVNPCIIKS